MGEAPGAQSGEGGGESDEVHLAETGEVGQASSYRGERMRRIPAKGMRRPRKLKDRVTDSRNRQTTTTP